MRNLTLKTFSFSLVLFVLSIVSCSKNNPLKNESIQIGDTFVVYDSKTFLKPNNTQTIAIVHNSEKNAYNKFAATYLNKPYSVASTNKRNLWLASGSKIEIYDRLTFEKVEEIEFLEGVSDIICVSNEHTYVIIGSTILTYSNKTYLPISIIKLPGSIAKSTLNKDFLVVTFKNGNDRDKVGVINNTDFSMSIIQNTIMQKIADVTIDKDILYAIKKTSEEESLLIIYNLITKNIEEILITDQVGYSFRYNIENHENKIYITTRDGLYMSNKNNVNFTLIHSEIDSPKDLIINRIEDIIQIIDGSPKNGAETIQNVSFDGKLLAEYEIGYLIKKIIVAE